MSGAATVGLLLAATRGIPAWYHWQRDAWESARAALLEEHESRNVVSSADLFASALAVDDKKLLGLAPALLEGETPAAAGASLTSVVEDAASSNNVRIGALQVNADSSAVDGVAHVSVRGDATGDVAGIAQFLTSLESGAPLLAVRDLSLTQSDPGAPGDRPEAVHVEFLIEGLARRVGDDGDARPAQHGAARVVATPARARDVTMYDADVLQRAADSLVANDVFRIERKPSKVAFGAPQPNTVPPAPPKPIIQLVLGGVMGGPPWRAVLSGVPGRDGSVVVATGDTLGGLKVKSVRPDVVIVQGPDTTWTLTVRH